MFIMVIIFAFAVESKRFRLFFLNIVEKNKYICHHLLERGFLFISAKSKSWKLSLKIVLLSSNNILAISIEEQKIITSEQLTCIYFASSKYLKKICLIHFFFRIKKINTFFIARTFSCVAHFNSN